MSIPIGKLIADAKDGQHVARLAGVWFQLAPQIFDVGVDAAVDAFKDHLVQAIDQLRGV